MTTIHQLTDNCLAVAGLPSEAKAWKNETYHINTLWYKSDEMRYPKHIDLPTGNWRILAKANELTEEQWKEVLSDHRIGSGIYLLGYENFQDIVYTETATESGASLLKLHKLENPLILIKE